VPQDSALFPHLSVWRQLTFGVGTDPALAAQWIERLGLCGLEDRLPHELSGGQRQRVALARALAFRPDILLLDEPFSALDKPLRDQLRRELRRLQAEIGVTTVLVTHDPEEAAILADEVVIIDGGRSLQAGTREAVFRHPASLQVARLLGIDNLRTGEMLSPTILKSHGTQLCASAFDLPPGTPVTWCIRSEHLLVRPESDAEPTGWVHGATVLEVLDLGGQREVSVALDGGLEMTATTLGGYDLAPGQRCRVTIPPGALRLWPARAGAQDGEITPEPLGPPGPAFSRQ
jgi:ABC-type Fe3+/spermidine/putrescine transport system ATPase subunit